MRQIIGLMIVITGLMTGCATHPLDKGRSFHLEKTDFSDLPGWTQDDFNESYPAIRQACQKPAPMWQDFCQNLPDTGEHLRAYMEQKLTPYAVESYGNPIGRITGYYEAELSGTRKRLNGAQVPVYGLPPDYQKDKIYPQRRDIEAGRLNAPIIAWADDPVELFLLHVQGSGRMETSDGEIHLGFAGSNNRSFKGIGQILIDEGLIGESGHSMIQIRDWLQQHPNQARNLMAQNERYIFFREVMGETPIGYAGVPLTPRHSVAVDKTYIPMQTPMWLDTKSPDGSPIQTLVVAQDIGHAIRGGVRADYFFGHGEDAFSLAGRMNHPGRYFLLLPN